MSQSAHQPLITVGICTRNRPFNILDAVTSVLANTYSNFELIIVDQSSNTATAEVLSAVRANPQVQYIASRETGISRARNLILKQARGEIVLMTDDDCTVEAEWIDQMHQIFVRHPQAAVVFCRIEAGPHDATAGAIPVLHYQGETVITKFARHTPARFLGAGMGMRREQILAIGGFDPSLGAGGTFPSAEDADIAIRAVFRGWPVVCSDQAHVMHHGFRTWEQTNKLLIRDYTGFGAMLAKHIRCGSMQIFGILARLTLYRFFATLMNIVRREPSGLRQILWLYRGCYYGWHAPIDLSRKLFNLPKHQADRIAFLIVDA